MTAFSTIDYPGHLATVLYVTGCNYSCWYCHNRSILDAEPAFTEEEALRHLKERAGFLTGVVVSGGEPTLQKDLLDFLREVKALGYDVKLDTNGSNPSVVAEAVRSHLVNYIAVDLKTVPEDYESIGARAGGRVLQTVATLRKLGANFEVRTTMIPEITEEKLKKMAVAVGAVPSYVLQQYREAQEDGNWLASPTPGELAAYGDAIRDVQPNVKIRAH